MAHRAAKRYRQRGLDKTARRLITFLEREGVKEATVLEIGGGVGEVQIELLKLGAARTLNLELSAAYENEAAQLLQKARAEDRADRRMHDIAADPDGVAAADVVVLNRVVCCYPDYERLLGAAAEHAERLLVFSYPRRNAISRLLIRLQNLIFKLRGEEFRAFVHPPSAMFGVLEKRGLHLAYAHHPVIWQIAGFARQT
jgi:magnesium-protoporphyrin O-methyltransferase